MRRRLLAAFVFGLASVTFWAAAMPFARGAPVAVAYSVAQGQGNAGNVVAAPHQILTQAVFQQAQDDLAPLSFDWWHFPAPTTAPAQATPLVLSTPAPLADSTAQPDPTPEPTPKATPQPTPKATPQPTPKATPEPTPKPTPEPTPAPVAYSGRSHFWYPALNIDAGWSWYGCDYGGDPNGLGGGVYRWGCGPDNNTYLLSHAWSTFKKLRLAFHSGALQVGQSVWYANAQGDVSGWRVKWIRRVTDEYLDATAGDWALNDSPTPIMTLQTCDGSQSQYRIIVRLVPAD